ncbi:hypothetical protein [Haloarcula argentinensis]|uniref:Uncharacterized protein n=1 Tax=Haloarcula argentinensis TaxID=43776 RepID=A0ABU2EX88_HALAR|nr:hypothetical protein [Haloarcula argentinensis]MDS0252889.1 hypothetical protein [Haloarcula argentinensis]
MVDGFDKIGGEYLRIKLALVVWAFVTISSSLIIQRFTEGLYGLAIPLILGVLFALFVYRGI